MNIIQPGARIPEDKFYGNNINDKIKNDIKENKENVNSEVKVNDTVRLSPEAREHLEAPNQLEAHNPRAAYRRPNS